MRNAESLADGLFSLDEPWRSRFLTLVANRATGWKRNRQPPTRDEVATWLGDQRLHRDVAFLLDVWQGEPDASHLSRWPSSRK